MSAQWKFLALASTQTSGMRGVEAMIIWAPRAITSGFITHT